MTITTFALLCQRCGLSRREAAAFLKVRYDTAHSWAIGRRKAPEGTIAELRSLYARIERSAAESLKIIARVSSDQIIELGLASDDCEAQSLNWPCVGTHAAVLGLVAARSDSPVIIVPRGSTVASAADADHH